MISQESKELDVLANRFNYEAEVMFGCSQQEVMRAIVYALLPSAFICGFLMLPLLGNFMFGFAGGVMIGMGVFCLVLITLQRLRKDQEIGYLTQRFQKQLSKMGLGYLDIFHRSGAWMIGRQL